MPSCTFGTKERLQLLKVNSVKSSLLDSVPDTLSPTLPFFQVSIAVMLLPYWHTLSPLCQCYLPILIFLIPDVAGKILYTEQDLSPRRSKMVKELELW